MSKRIFILSFFLMAAVGCFAEKTPACFASAPSDNLDTAEKKSAFVKDFNNAAAIFTGKVIALDDYEVKFEIDKVWKGQITSVFTMSTGTVKQSNGWQRSTTCDYTFEKGKSYLVFAYRMSAVLFNEKSPLPDGETLLGRENLLVTYLTKRTRPVEQAEQGIKNLNDRQEPQKMKQNKEFN